MIELIFWGLFSWLVGSFIVKFLSNYKQLSEDYDGGNRRGKYVFLQIRVECIDDLWYGWYVNDTEEAFVAQGGSYKELIITCKRRLEEKNPEYTILFKFEMKHDKQPALQN